MSRVVCNPIEDRVLARLRYYKEHGPHFEHVVDDIRTGPRRQYVDANINPIAVHAYVVPFSAHGRAKANHETLYRAKLVVGVEGGNCDDEEGRRQFNQTLDDIGHIVEELEQEARWQERTGEYAGTVKIAAAEEMVFETNEEELGVETYLWYGRGTALLTCYVRWGSAD